MWLSSHHCYTVSMYKNIRIVLVETSHPGNIGAVARAMKNMCLSRLTLVKPKVFPSPEAQARASGAQDVLGRAQVVSSLVEAVGGCSLVIGSSARQRATLWQVLDPRECAARLATTAEHSEVALVFGRESTGLTAQELDLCTHLVHIPANPEYSSLNIAMAVQVLSYELRMHALVGQRKAASEPEQAIDPPASMQQMEGLFTHLEQALRDIGFLQPGREGKILQRLRRLLHRATPDQREVNILRGILSSAQGGKSMRGAQSQAEDA